VVKGRKQTTIKRVILAVQHKSKSTKICESSSAQILMLLRSHYVAHIDAQYASVVFKSNRGAIPCLSRN